MQSPPQCSSRCSSSGGLPIEFFFKRRRFDFRNDDLADVYRAGPVGGWIECIRRNLTRRNLPPDFTCLAPEPRDGACQHPALVLDAQTKSTRYEGDRFSRAYEKACIAKTGSSAVRRAGELRLRFNNGSSRIYKDNQSKAACDNGPYQNCKKYILYDYFPEHRLFLVNVGYGESDDWLLVREQDGKEEQIVAPPSYSPNKKWLASVYNTDGPDDGNNGIDIVSASPNPSEPAFHYRPKDYELWEFVGWDGDDRLLLKVTSRAGNDPELVTWPAGAIRLNGQWQLNSSAPTSSRP